MGAACAPLRVLNALVTAHPYRRVAGVAYGSFARQRLDIYIPKRPRAGSPVVVFWYGGYWRHGHRKNYRFVGEALASKGVLTVIPDYRLYPSVSWRGFVNDGARAYRWTVQHIAGYGGNAGRVFVMGHSAGAYIAAMVALDRSLPLAQGVPRPCGLIGLAGPYAFLPIKDPAVRQVFSGARRLIDTQPIHYVSSGEPPLLLMAGTDDHTVNPRNSDRLARAARAAGAQAQVLHYPGVGHIGLLLALAAPFRFLAPVLPDTVRFIQDTSCRS
ncbi:MAG: alpha/beta hydrolase [Acidiferrobacteraceae bacterium]